MGNRRFTADAVVTCDADDSVFAPGVVDTVNGRIAWVGPADSAPVVDDTVPVEDKIGRAHV